MAKLRESDASYRRKVATQRVLKEVICLILCIISIIPFLILFINATRTSEAIKVGLSLIPAGNLGENWTNFNLKQNGMQLTVFKAMVNSFIIAVPATFLSVYFSTLTAYGIHVYDFKLKKAAWSFILAVMIVPVTISAIGFYRFMLKLNLLDTYWPLIVPSVAAPAIVFFMKQYMESTLSKELVEAARIDGANDFMIWLKVVLPLCKPVLATVALFIAVGQWNSFMDTYLYARDLPTLQYMLYEIMQQATITVDPHAAAMQAQSTVSPLSVRMAVTIIATIPILIVYPFLQKYFVGGMTVGAVKD